MESDDVDDAACSKKNSGRGLFSEKMLPMGPFTKAIDRLVDQLPGWAKLLGAPLVVFGCVYSVHRFGFFTFLLKVIFSPLP